MAVASAAIFSALKKPAVDVVFGNQIIRTVCVPRPLAGQGRRRGSAVHFRQRPEQPAPVQQGDGMPPFAAAGIDHLMHRHGCRIGLDFHFEFLPGHSLDALGRSLLKANDATGDVPSRPVKVVLAPGEERLTGVVLDEQVDIDQRRDAADEKKERFGETGAGVGDVGLNGVEGGSEIVLSSHTELQAAGPEYSVQQDRTVFDLQVLSHLPGNFLVEYR